MTSKVPTVEVLDLDVLFSDLATYAEIAGVPFNTKATHDFINLFDDIYPTATIAIRTTNQPNGKRDVNYRYMTPDIPHDPYQRLVESGLYTPDGHAVEAVLPEVLARYSGWWGVDAAVSHGFEKLWLFFEQPVEFYDLLTMPSLPDSIRKNRYHIKHFIPGDVISLIGLDFKNKSMNLYPSPFIPGSLTPNRIATLLADLDFDLPSAKKLELSARAMWFYYTFNWDSPDIQRVCFMVYTPAEHYPFHLDPLCKPFVEQVPMRAEQKMYIYSPTFARQGDYLKIEADYRGPLENLFRMYPMQEFPAE